MVDFDPTMKYLIFQLEVGESGTEHYQGFVQFNSQRTMSAAKRIIGQSAHLELRRGTIDQAIHYCKKPVENCECVHCKDCEPSIEGPFEYGTHSGGQGTRNDLKKYVTDVKSGKRKAELMDDHFRIMCNHRHFYADIRMLERPPQKNRFVMLLYGETGAGKTLAVTRGWKDADYWDMPCSRQGIWFDGYDLHERVLMDDFAGALSGVKLVNILKLLHEYPSRQEIKGGHTYFNPSMIVITTNIHPNKWYDYKDRAEQRSALMRRINEVWIYNRGQDPVLADEDWFNDDYTQDYTNYAGYDSTRGRGSNYSTQ